MKSTTFTVLLVSAMAGLASAAPKQHESRADQELVDVVLYAELGAGSKDDTKTTVYVEPDKCYNIGSDWDNRTQSISYASYYSKHKTAQCKFFIDPGCSEADQDKFFEFPGGEHNCNVEFRKSISSIVCTVPSEDRTPHNS